MWECNILIYWLTNVLKLLLQGGVIYLSIQSLLLDSSLFYSNSQEIQELFYYIILTFGVVMDLVLTVLQLLRRDLQAVVDSMEPVELWDKGQLSYVVRNTGNIGMQEHCNIPYILIYQRTQDITIGRSYIFKYIVPTIKQFSSLQ